MTPAAAGGERTRVCHVITQSTPFGGAQRNTLLSVAGLTRSGWDVDLVCGAGGPLIPEARAAGVRVHVLGDLVRPVRPARDVRALLGLVRLFRAGRHALVHTHSTKAGLLGRLAARAAGVPAVLHTVHGYPFEMTGAKARVYSRLEAIVSRCTDRVICVGEALRAEVAAHSMAPAAKCVTVYSGIDFRALRPTRSPVAMRERLDLAEAWPVIGSVGQLIERKAYQHLIEAVARLVPRHPRLHLLVVGEGPWRPILEARIAALGLGGHVTLLGERGDVADVLQVLDVYAMPSLWEGVGRALTEAMYMARPVVATAINGVTELVRHEVTGLLVPPYDPPALAAAIQRLVTDRALAQRLGEEGRRLVVERMDADRMIAELEHLYATVLRAPSDRPGPAPAARPASWAGR